MRFDDVAGYFLAAPTTQSTANIREAAPATSGATPTKPCSSGEPDIAARNFMRQIS